MAKISCKNLTLYYDMHTERTASLKEAVINFIHKKKYSDKNPIKFAAIDNLTLEVSDGARLGIIGKNGAGKSTLLKVISNILKPQKGSIQVYGSIQPLIEIAAGFNPELTGRENIYLNSYMMGFSRAQVRQREEEIVEFSELQKFIDTPVKYYSSGMSVRLAFTIATLIAPEILVFDEMLSAGDASFIEKAKKRLDEMIAKAKIIILVSHDLAFIESFCNRCLVFENGKVIFDGEPSAAVSFYTARIKQQ